MDICQNYGVKAPDFAEVADGFKVVLYNKKLDKMIDVGVKSLTERLATIVEMLKEDSSLTSADLSKALGVTKRTIERDFAELKQLNIIKRVDSDKSGFWKVMEEGK